jgi:hypothetical protein
MSMNPGDRICPFASIRRTFEGTSIDPGVPILVIRPPDTSTSATNGSADSSPVITVGDWKRIFVAMMG